MKLHFNPRITGWFLAALVLVFTQAHAATGFTITRDGESVVTIGMTPNEVQQLIGKPARVANYRAAPGPTWTYRVVDPLFGRTEFNVEFDALQKVMATGEIVIGSESPDRR